MYMLNPTPSSHSFVFASLSGCHTALSAPACLAFTSTIAHPGADVGSSVMPCRGTTSTPPDSSKPSTPSSLLLLLARLPPSSPAGLQHQGSTTLSSQASYSSLWALSVKPANTDVMSVKWSHLAAETGASTSLNTVSVKPGGTTTCTHTTTQQQRVT